MHQLIPAAILIMSLSPATPQPETGVTTDLLAQSFFPAEDDDRPELFLPVEGDSDPSNFEPREGDSDPSNFEPVDGDSDADNFDNPDLDDLSRPAPFDQRVVA